jgi:uncharacterized Ntn-hydrolase superfamily protein
VRSGEWRTSEASSLRLLRRFLGLDYLLSHGSPDIPGSSGLIHHSDPDLHCQQSENHNKDSDDYNYEFNGRFRHGHHYDNQVLFVCLLGLVVWLQGLPVGKGWNRRSAPGSKSLVGSIRGRRHKSSETPKVVRLTYSIVARDEKTGEMGVAVQSHYFSVGSVVSWARAGVGAVATQSVAEISYGPLGLELMGSGKSAPEALDALLRADARLESRQVAMVDSKGRVAAHTGIKCIPFAGHMAGDGFSCQGNIMRSEKVWTSMHDSFLRNGDLPFAERLVAALETGEGAGGDIRGRQSAALLVVSADVSPSYWPGRLIDLRVEDHPEPVPELKRLLRYQRGYDLVSKGDDFLSSANYLDALKTYQKALDLVPEMDELRYWVGISLLAAGQKERGLSMLKEVFDRDRNWVQVTKGILQVGSPPIDPALVEDLLR